MHACECVLGKKRKRDSNWISAETWSLIDKRREIKEKSVCKITETNQQSARWLIEKLGKIYGRIRECTRTN